MPKGVSWVLVVVVLFAMFPGPVLAQGDPACLGAPVPRLNAPGQGRVLPGGARVIRDAASRTGNITGEIPGTAVFDVQEGPVCAEGYNWWRVAYAGLDGWTVEGEGTGYWLEPYVPGQPPAPALLFEPAVPIVNDMATGIQVRVQTPGDVLPLRAEPDPAADLIGQAEDGMLLTVLDGPQEAGGYRWWQVAQEDGPTGWAAEGYGVSRRLVQTLVPVCAQDTDRLAFVIFPVIYTANLDGSAPCNLATLDSAYIYTSWRFFTFPMWKAFWSPDGRQVAYVSMTASDDSTYYYDVFTVQADGRAARRLTSESGTYWLDWSPDSRRIVLTRTLNDTGYPQVWVMNADGSDPARLTTGTPPRPWAAWLADGQTIIYVEEIGDPEARGQIRGAQGYILRTVGADGSDTTELLTIMLDIRDIALSPDRSLLAFTGAVWNEYSELVGSQLVVLDPVTGEIRLQQDAPPNYGFLWTLEGDALLFAKGTTLTYLDVPSGTPHTVPAAAPDGAWLGTWAPDGAAWYVTANSGLYLADAAAPDEMPRQLIAGEVRSVSVQP